MREPVSVTAVCLLALGLPLSGLSGQEIIAGWEGDASRGYGFASPVFGIGLGGPHALVVRGAGSHLYYRSIDSSGITRVTSPGASAGLAYRVRAGRVSATIGAGYEVRRTTRRPPVGGSTRVTERGFTAQGELFVQATSLTNLNLIGSYGDANRYWWGRAGVKRQITNTHFAHSAALAIGVEGTAQGNHESSAYEAGALVAIEFLRSHGSLQFRGGYTQSRYPGGPAEARMYLGAGLYRAF